LEISPLIITVATEAFVVLIMACIGLSWALLSQKKQTRQIAEKAMQSADNLKPLKRAFEKSDKELQDSYENLRRLKKLNTQIEKEKREALDKNDQLEMDVRAFDHRNKKVSDDLKENQEEISTLERQLSDLTKDRQEHIELIEELESELNLTRERASQPQTNTPEFTGADNNSQAGDDIDLWDTDSPGAEEMINDQGLEDEKSGDNPNSDDSIDLWGDIDEDEQSEQNDSIEESEDESQSEDSKSGDAVELWGDVDTVAEVESDSDSADSDPPDINADDIELWGEITTVDSNPGVDVVGMDSSDRSNKQAARKEATQLRATINDQRQLIYDLKARLIEPKANDTDTLTMEMAQAVSELEQLEQKLNESNTCIEILEDEIEELKQNHNPLGSSDAFDAVAENSEQQNSAEIDQLKQELESMNQMAGMLMANTGDQSNVINLAKDSINCQTYEQLAKTIVEQVSNFGVSTSLFIRGKNKNVELSNAGNISQMERQQLSRMRGTQRFKKNGNELLVQHPGMSLLIKNMPTDDNDKCGRIQDSTAIMLDLAASTAENIGSNLTLKQQQQVMTKIISSTHNMIKDVEDQFQHQATESKNIVDTLTYSIGNSTFTSSMSPQYKTLFFNILNESKQRFEALHNKGVSVDDSFSKIMDRLNSKVG